MKIGIIGGTGFYNLLDDMQEKTVYTEYGEVTVFQAYYEGKEVTFLPRHGKYHDTLAPFVNYRANMMALKELGIQRILAFSAVGAINPDIQVGSLSLLDQFVDFTTREKTYGKFSVDITEPFCPELQETYRNSAELIDEPLRVGTKLICVDGPRYETKAEVQLFGKWGMDVVGMTNATEASLARELGICYAVVTLATNMAPGVTETKPSLKAHKAVSESKKEKVKELMLEAIKQAGERQKCSCPEAYERAVLANS
ncbi:MTAP family purine nucleoside phosphorylase [Alkalihalobacillus hwajinpoensis]|uniref:MTAP family purine nucleoside phosphorylase n=1 Tax=Guptibacillus hwajinpoensis TaxID=208199 RepID=UPI001883475D|nr:MTAP family purine nucleoside phosphorylase [Pseudalkalibacillus hwajinpoensis]MBF0707816.1 MTAP family purine nucleoside phosphorylase [Pseudalkalibacillus hwajinpoensis]